MIFSLRIEFFYIFTNYQYKQRIASALSQNNHMNIITEYYQNIDFLSPLQRLEQRFKFIFQRQIIYLGYFIGGLFISRPRNPTLTWHCGREIFMCSYITMKIWRKDSSRILIKICWPSCFLSSFFSFHVMYKAHKGIWYQNPNLHKISFILVVALVPYVQYY